MNYRIEKKDAIRVVGVMTSTNECDGSNMRDLPVFWQDCYKNGTAEKIKALSNKEPSGLLGVGVGTTSEKGSFNYYISAATDKPVPEGMFEYTLPPLLWAVFESRPEDFHEMNKRIFTEWFPSSGYECGEAYGIEIHTEGSMSYFWFPVMKKG